MCWKRTKTRWSRLSSWAGTWRSKPPLSARIQWFIDLTWKSSMTDHFLFLLKHFRIYRDSIWRVPLLIFIITRSSSHFFCPTYSSPSYTKSSLPTSLPISIVFPTYPTPSSLFFLSNPLDALVSLFRFDIECLCLLLPSNARVPKGRGGFLSKSVSAFYKKSLSFESWEFAIFLGLFKLTRVVEGGDGISPDL